MKNILTQLFGETLDNKDYQGKSDTEIFHALTKDDAAAFENVTAFHLEGGANKGFGEVKKYTSKDNIMKIKDAGERQQAISETMNLFANG